MVTLGFACKTYITCMIQQVCMYVCACVMCACMYVCSMSICTRPHHIMCWPVFKFSIIRQKYKESIHFTMN